jgi:hypothetical protein
MPINYEYVIEVDENGDVLADALPKAVPNYAETINKDPLTLSMKDVLDNSHIPCQVSQKPSGGVRQEVVNNGWIVSGQIARIDWVLENKPVGDIDTDALKRERYNEVNTWVNNQVKTAVKNTTATDGTSFNAQTRYPEDIANLMLVGLLAERAIRTGSPENISIIDSDNNVAEVSAEVASELVNNILTSISNVKVNGANHKIAIAALSDNQDIIDYDIS